MHRLGYVFVPESCENNSNLSGQCRLHVAFHGCHQDTDSIHDKFFRGAGYNRYAAANNIIVLYPQAVIWDERWDWFGQTDNPSGCWDWWGYTDHNFYLKSGKQMQAVKAMIDHMLGL